MSRVAERGRKQQVGGDGHVYGSYSLFLNKSSSSNRQNKAPVYCFQQLGRWGVGVGGWVGAEGWERNSDYSRDTEA